MDHLVLSLSCPDRPGIVAAVAGYIAKSGYNIEEASQYEDRATQRFFMRTEISDTGQQGADADTFADAFTAVAAEYQMEWTLQRSSYQPRTVIAVSKAGHCLSSLLHKWQAGVLPIDVIAVVSNHENLRTLSEWHGVPFHHLPVTEESKAEQEATFCQLLEDKEMDLLVLARYMQILSPEMCARYSGRIINIHHSFLPGFKGARPYHQAYDRGVKLIGATAHYVTADLDDGPIIEQAVERVSHANSPKELVQVGHDIESVALARAVQWHAERRVLINGNKTVVFRR